LTPIRSANGPPEPASHAASAKKPMVSQKVARLAKRERKSALASFQVAVLVGPRQ